MNEADIRPLIAAYLDEATLMQLATTSAGGPWVCSVWFAADEDLTLYWFSSLTRRHVTEVLADPRVAGAIALPHTPDGPARGVQFEGTCRLLESDEDVRAARSRYAGRIFPDERIDEFLNSPDRPHRFFAIRPTRFVLFDTVNFPENSRRELVLGGV